MKIYRGVRHADGSVEVTAINLAGRQTELDWETSLILRNHSPDGPEWGYGGSGPAQLALALLLSALGDPDESLELYQQFKWAVVSGLAREQWTLTQGEIRTWCDLERDRRNALEAGADRIG